MITTWTFKFANRMKKNQLTKKGTVKSPIIQSFTGYYFKPKAFFTLPT